MAAFEYTAMNPLGKTVKGVMEGEGGREVRDRLREKGLIPMEVRQVRRRSKGGGMQWRSSSRVSLADISLITRQMATLVRSGLPLEETLSAVAQQTDNRRLQSIMMAVRAKVLEGHALASGMGEFPHVFSALYRETVGAGEQTGRLDEVLERLADYLENSQTLRQKVILAMIYPMVVLVFALGVTVALLTFVVPKVVKVFADFNQELPPLTRGMIALSDFLREHGLALLFALLAVVVVFRLLLRREGPRRLYHRFLLVLPLVRRLVRGLNAARFARTFGILTASGVPVLEGLEISSRVVGNLPMRQVVENATIRVREGTSLHLALQSGGIFTPLVLHLIANGEASGNLAEMLDRAAVIQEREVESLVATLAGIFEPLLIILMGGAVLTIVMAILLPIFDLNQLIR